MPVNSSHAYGGGNVFGEKKPPLFFPFIHRLLNWLEKQQTQLVWETFKKNSVMGSECYLGLTHGA